MQRKCGYEGKKQHAFFFSASNEVFSSYCAGKKTKPHYPKNIYIRSPSGTCNRTPPRHEKRWGPGWLHVGARRDKAHAWAAQKWKPRR